jgi:hypothetical protein
LHDSDKLATSGSLTATNSYNGSSVFSGSAAVNTSAKVVVSIAFGQTVASASEVTVGSPRFDTSYGSKLSDLFSGSVALRSSADIAKSNRLLVTYIFLSAGRKASLNFDESERPTASPSYNASGAVDATGNVFNSNLPKGSGALFASEMHKRTDSGILSVIHECSLHYNVSATIKGTVRLSGSKEAKNTEFAAVESVLRSALLELSPLLIASPSTHDKPPLPSLPFGFSGGLTE